MTPRVEPSCTYVRIDRTKASDMREEACDSRERRATDLSANDAESVARLLNERRDATRVGRLAVLSEGVTHSSVGVFSTQSGSPSHRYKYLHFFIGGDIGFRTNP